MFETMRWEKGKLYLLDQTKLPLEESRIVCPDYLRVKTAIERLEVRGAPAIGAAAAFAMVLGAAALKDTDDFLKQLDKIRRELNSARPTAVNLSWGTNEIYALAVKLAAEKASAAEIIRGLEAKALRIYENDININRAIGRFGAALLAEDSVILTHCNAGALATCGWGTALGVIREAHSQGKIRMVYADETRPLLQGARLTAFELSEAGIPVTVITDSMAAWTMKRMDVDAVITGADRIAANGDTANKIGTYGLALAARAHGIPFYIAAPLNTFDFDIADGKEIIIEERSGEEIRTFAGTCTVPPKALTYNPAFDVTPSELIDGIITEYGVITAPYTENIKALSANKYGKRDY